MPEMSSAALLAEDGGAGFCFEVSGPGACAGAKVLSIAVNKRSVLKRELSMDLSDSNADIILLLALKYTPHAAGFKIRYG
jgi:hypothetical protein